MVPAWRFSMFLSVVLLANACGSNVTHPTPVVQVEPSVVTTQPPPPVSVTRTVRGIVLDEDSRPVEGASVAPGISASPSPVVTDAAGAFEFRYESRHSPFVPAVALLVQKVGYEPTSGWGGSDCCERVRLYRIHAIAAGGTETLTMFGEAYCDRFSETPCRRVRVKSAAAGRLTVRVSPEDFSILLPDTAPFGPVSSPSLSVQVGPQSETSFDVWHTSGWFQGQGRAFTLTSSVE
jgi:hypothetical protein